MFQPDLSTVFGSNQIGINVENNSAFGFFCPNCKQTADRQAKLKHISPMNANQINWIN